MFYWQWWTKSLVWNEIMELLKEAKITVFLEQTTWWAVNHRLAQSDTLLQLQPSLALLGIWNPALGIRMKRILIWRYLKKLSLPSSPMASCRGRYSSMHIVWLRVSYTYLPCTLEHNGVVAHFALGDAKCSQESSNCYCSSTCGVLQKNMDTSSF